MPLDSGGKIRKRKAQTSEGETRATLDVKKSLETEQGLQIEHQSATWSAPLPPPAALAQYEEILPGSAQKIFVSFEERGNTRQQLEINEQRQEAKMQELTHDSFVSGQKYGWQISLVRPLQKGLFLPPALFANAHLLLNKQSKHSALLPSWEQKLPFFARGLKLCKTLTCVYCGRLD